MTHEHMPPGAYVRLARAESRADHARTVRRSLRARRLRAAAWWLLMLGTLTAGLVALAMGHPLQGIG